MTHSRVHGSCTHGFRIHGSRIHGAMAFATALVAFLACLPAAGPAMAQGSDVSNALQGFTRNKDQPVRINADRLEVRDKEKVAIFSGNVEVQQGDTTLRTRDLKVHYDGSGMNPDGGEPLQSGQIRKLEASGGVVVRTPEQTATGDTGIFEMQTQTLTLDGNPVVLTQGKNVLRGKKLSVNLATGVSRLHGGRVESLILPGSVKTPAAPR